MSDLALSKASHAFVAKRRDSYGSRMFARGFAAGMLFVLVAGAIAVGIWWAMRSGS